MSSSDERLEDAAQIAAILTAAVVVGGGAVAICRYGNLKAMIARLAHNRATPDDARDVEEAANTDPTIRTAISALVRRLRGAGATAAADRVAAALPRRSGSSSSVSPQVDARRTQPALMPLGAEQRADITPRGRPSAPELAGVAGSDAGSERQRPSPFPSPFASRSHSPGWMQREDPGASQTPRGQHVPAPLDVDRQTAEPDSTRGVVVASSTCFPHLRSPTLPRLRIPGFGRRREMDDASQQSPEPAPRSDSGTIRVPQPVPGGAARQPEPRRSASSERARHQPESRGGALGRSGPGEGIPHQTRDPALDSTPQQQRQQQQAGSRNGLPARIRPPPPPPPPTPAASPSRNQSPLRHGTPDRRETQTQVVRSKHPLADWNR